MANFVLVHGSWHGAWCWRHMASLLRANGHNVFVPTLSGCAEKVHLVDRGITLDTHVDDVANLLFYEDLEEVILVGHSYAGMVIHGVANKIPQRLEALVYLDAYVVPPGKKGFDLWTAERLAEARQLIASGYPYRKPFPPELLGVSDARLLEWMKLRLTPHPLATYDQVIEEATPQALQLPRIYVQCSEGPLASIFAPIVDMVREWGWPIKTIAGPHDIMMTHPKELAELCSEYATELSRTRSHSTH